MTTPNRFNRVALHNEVHARPYQLLTAPTVMLHWVYCTIGQGADFAHAHFAQLLRDHHLPVPDASCNHIIVDIAQYTLRWERHSEFVTYTLWHATQHDNNARDLPYDLFPHSAGELIAAIELHVHNAAYAANNADVIASEIAKQNVIITTDFQIKSNGFSQWNVYDNAIQGSNPRRLGRIAQQLLEIETYRMMVLLGLPAAREASEQLKQFEIDLVRVSKAIDRAAKTQEPELLEDLTRLASQVESLYATHHARFSATHAYMDLVNQRLTELNESSIAEFPTLRTFLARRLNPAAQTCAWTARRMQAMSERISRNSNLLRTRVEIEQQEHHKALLSTMNDRQLSQLRLQSTVEGLSTIAITYYAAGLVGYIAKAAHAYGWPLSVELSTALAIPVVAISVYWGLHKLKASIHKGMTNI